MPGIVSIDRRTEVVGGMSSVEARPWDSSPAVCRCQLIIWGPGQNGDLDVSPDTPQELIPAAYTNVVMEPDGVWEGRFMLLPPNTASQPPAQDWIIEALDRHGRVTSALEFARLNGHSVSWSSQIIGAPTMCEEYLRFQVRRAFNGAVSDPRDPNDHYWIRARRPRTGPEESAVICKVKVRLGAYLPGGYIATPPREDHDTYATPPEPYRPPRGGEDTYAPTAEQPRAPREPEPTYATPVFLGEVTPPGPDGIGDRRLGESTLVQDPAPQRRACRCQLIVWDPARRNIQLPNKDQPAPQLFRFIEIDRDADKALKGRFCLSGEGPREFTGRPKWRIEARNSDGTVNDYFRFRVEKDAGVVVAGSLESKLERSSNECNAEVEFSFKPTFRVSPNDPNRPGDRYKIVAYWGDNDANPVATCEVELRISAPECACKIRLLTGAESSAVGSVVGYTASPDGRLGVCLNVENNACPIPETVAIEVTLSGLATKKAAFKVFSLSDENPRDLKDKPLMLKRLDFSDERKRPVRRPDGKWEDDDWQQQVSLDELCDFGPVRFLARLMTPADDSNAKALSRDLYRYFYDTVGLKVPRETLSGQALPPKEAVRERKKRIDAEQRRIGETPEAVEGEHKWKLEEYRERLWTSDLAVAWREARKPVYFVVATTLSAKAEDRMCPALPIDVVPRGGIWVGPIRERFNDSDAGDTGGVVATAKRAVIEAVRRIAGLTPTDEQIHWAGNIEPAADETGRIVATQTFCDDSPVDESTARETRQLGRYLIARLLCGTHCFGIAHGGEDSATPYDIHQAVHPDQVPASNKTTNATGDAKERKIKAPHWDKTLTDCLGADIHVEDVGREETKFSSAKSKGLGTGGVVRISGNTIKGSTRWTVANISTDGRRWLVGPNSPEVNMDFERVLAHELAHLLLYSRGVSPAGIGMQDKADMYLLQGSFPLADPVSRVWGPFGNGNFQTKEERDVIVNWENYIARELGSLTPNLDKYLPRFSHA